MANVLQVRVVYTGEIRPNKPTETFLFQKAVGVPAASKSALAMYHTLHGVPARFTWVEVTEVEVVGPTADVHVPALARTDFFRSIGLMENVCENATEATRKTVETVLEMATNLAADAQYLLRCFDDPKSGVTPTASDELVP